MLPEVWEASKPGDQMREWRTRAVAKPTIRFRKSVGTSGRLKGCRPSAAFAASHFTGLAPNVTFGSGVGTGRPGSGAGNRKARHPSNVVLRGRRRWTCPVHWPRSGTARTRETNDIDPLGRKAGDLVVRGGLSARSRLLLRVPWQLRARSTRRGRAWLRGVPGVQETARSAVSCTGLRGASSHSTVFPRVSLLRRGIQL